MIEKLPFLPDEHHYAIAHVAARSSQMEHHIEHLVSAAFAGQPETAEFLLKNLGTDRMVGLLKAALIDKFPQSREPAERLCAEIGRLRTLRNNLLHWIWGKSEDPTKGRQASIRPFRENQTRELTAGDIQAIADDMLSVSRAMVTWQEDCLVQIRQRIEMHKPSNETLEQRFLRQSWASPLAEHPEDTPQGSDPQPLPVTK